MHNKISVKKEENKNKNIYSKRKVAKKEKNILLKKAYCLKKTCNGIFKNCTKCACTVYLCIKKKYFSN